jgi:type 1 glutamine amidotransferase
LEDSGRFAATVATTPAKGTAPNQDMSSFAPRFSDYQIMKGLPPAWMHAKDELYSNLRGPARNVTVLATATAPTSNGAGENEPLVMAIAYGRGRVFHDTLGHVGATEKEPIAPMNSVDYIVLLQRGTEWAATGAVTIPVPRDFPTADKTSIR